MVLLARGTRALLRPDCVSHPDSSPLSPIGEGIIKRESKTRARGELYPHKYSHEKEARLSSQRIELQWTENDSAFNCILLTPYHIFIHLFLSLTRSVSPILARPIALRAPQQMPFEVQIIPNWNSFSKGF